MPHAGPVLPAIPASSSATAVNWTYVGISVGSIVGAGLLIAAILLLTWSWRSYSLRAYKRHLEDQVHAIVLASSAGSKQKDSLKSSDASHVSKVG